MCQRFRARISSGRTDEQVQDSEASMLCFLPRS